MPVQEITLDFVSFTNLIKQIVNDSFNNPNYYNNYSELINNIKEFHLFCVDKKTDGDGSEWFNLFNELQNKLPLLSPEAPHIQKLIIGNFSPLLLPNKHKQISSDKKDIRSICEDIAMKSDFKLLIDDSKKSINDLNKITIKEFNEGVHPRYKCLLLRKAKSVHFHQNEDTNSLKFLHPYLFYSKNLTIRDKFFLKEEYHKKILNILLSYIDVPGNVFIYTQFSDHKDKIVHDTLQSIKNSFPSVKLNLINNKSSHPRRITTDYATIEMTHTLDSLVFVENKLKSQSDISFIIELKNGK